MNVSFHDFYIVKTKLISKIASKKKNISELNFKQFKHNLFFIFQNESLEKYLKYFFLIQQNF